MLIVKVELWPHGDGDRAQELGRMAIANVGGTDTRGDYTVHLGKGDDAAGGDFDGQVGLTEVEREGDVYNHPRLTESVWSLVAKSLASVGFEGAAPHVEGKPYASHWPTCSKCGCVTAQVFSGAWMCSRCPP